MCLGPKFLKSGCLGVLVASWVRSGVLVYRSGFWNSSFFVVQSYDYDWISVMHTYLWLAMFSLFYSVDFLNKVIHYNSCLSACSRAWPVALVLLHKATTKQLPLQSLSFCTLDIDLQEVFKRFSLGTIQSMEVWDGYLERQGWGIFFKAPWPNPVRVFFFFYRSIFSQQKDAECIINSFSLHKLLGDPLMSFWRRYPVSTQALPWWPPGHNGNNVFSSFGASKKVTLENLPNNFWSWSRQRFFFGQSGRKKRLRLKRRMLRIVEIFFCFGCTTPMKNGRNYLPTYVPQLVGSCSWVVLPMRIVGIILPKLIRTKAQAKLWERRCLILLGRSLVKSLLTFISLGCHPWSRLGRWMNPLNHHFNRNPPIYGEETSEVAW